MASMKDERRKQFNRAVRGKSKYSSKKVDKPKINDVKVPKEVQQELESNWDRYSLDPEDDMTQNVGNNYQDVLSSNSGQVTSFRFKDEKMFDDLEDLAGQQFCTVDVNKLVAMLGCIPLHEQLEIDSELFTPDMISDMVKTAKENVSLLNKVGGEMDDTSSQVPINEDTDNTSFCDLASDTRSSSGASETGKQENASGSKTELLKLTEHDDVLDSVLSFDTSSNLTPQDHLDLHDPQSHDISHDQESRMENQSSEKFSPSTIQPPEDIDLDGILDLADDSLEIGTAAKNQREHSVPHQNSNLENENSSKDATCITAEVDLDALLGEDSGASNTTAVTSNASKFIPSKVEDMDDLLDSLLLDD